jgi:pimeloyl-ACP methyl ester carboxylesterase
MRFARRVVIALVCVASSVSWAQAQKYEDHYFDSNGVKIHYQMAGEGEPVLLIHGFSANIQAQWMAPKIFSRLAENYRVIALDNRGHGKSEKPHEREKYGLEMVDDAIRLLDHLGIDKAHIVGYSMGAFITNKLLSLHPDRFITATLGGAGWYRDTDTQMKFMDELAESLETGGGITPLIKRLTPAGAPEMTKEQLQGLNNMFLLINDSKALAAVIRGSRALEIKEESLKANQVPVLALIGEIDPLKDGVDELVAVMPHVKLVVIESADHMTAFADATFIEELESFLEQHSLAPATAGAGN